MDNEATKLSWHVGKEIPAMLILAVVLQTGGMIWSLSGLASKVDTAIDQLKEVRAERYTKEDARRDTALVLQRESDIERRLLLLETQRGGR